MQLSTILFHHGVDIEIKTEWVVKSIKEIAHDFFIEDTPVEYEVFIILKYLISWDIKDNNGGIAPINKKVVMNLSAKAVRTMVGSYLEYVEKKDKNKNPNLSKIEDIMRKIEVL